MGYRKVSVSRRLACAAIDAAIFFPVVAIVFLSALASSHSVGGSKGGLASNSILVSGFLGATVVEVIEPYSWGKRILSVHIVDKEGKPVWFLSRLIRWLVNHAVLLLICLEGFIEELRFEVGYSTAYGERLGGIDDVVSVVICILCVKELGYLGIFFGVRPLHDYLAGTDVAYAENEESGAFPVVMKTRDGT